MHLRADLGSTPARVAPRTNTNGHIEDVGTKGGIEDLDIPGGRLALRVRAADEPLQTTDIGVDDDFGLCPQCGNDPVGDLLPAVRIEEPEAAVVVGAGSSFAVRVACGGDLSLDLGRSILERTTQDANINAGRRDAEVLHESLFEFRARASSSSIARTWIRAEGQERCANRAARAASRGVPGQPRRAGRSRLRGSPGAPRNQRSEKQTPPSPLAWAFVEFWKRSWSRSLGGGGLCSFFGRSAGGRFGRVSMGVRGSLLRVPPWASTARPGRPGALAA